MNKPVVLLQTQMKYLRIATDQKKESLRRTHALRGRHRPVYREARSFLKEKENENKGKNHIIFGALVVIALFLFLFRDLIFPNKQRNMCV